MSRLHQAAIKELAKAIANGNTCYIHHTSRKITTIDNEIEDKKIIAEQAKAIAAIESKIDNHFKIEPQSTGDQIEIMKYFIDEVSDKSVRKEITNALKRKNPIRNFMQVIESDMELRQRWRIFKFEEDQRWVSNFLIDAYNY
jgi:DNA-directed RNA polymerase beta' subunit